MRKKGLGLKSETRLNPEVFFRELPIDKIRRGWYSDVYFNRSKYILEKDNHHPHVIMQVFQKHDAIVCGMDEAIAILRLCSGYFNEKDEFINGWGNLEVNALYDGDSIKPYETAMTISGDYSLFAHLETLYLGVLTRRTKVATNTAAVVKAAGSKPLLFFPARFDHPFNQTGDGYAAYISGALGVSTDAQAAWWGARGLGTIPHSLIACYGGNTALATSKFAEYISPDVNVIALVDFDNDCVKTSLECAKALGRRLWGVRLDTSGTMVDKSLHDKMGQFDPRGVNPELVRMVRKALNDQGYDWIKIVVSGGFNPEKIAKFEREKAPVDAYAVGSWLLRGEYEFTADIVMVDGKSCGKEGRTYKPNPRLVRVD